MYKKIIKKTVELVKEVALLAIILSMIFPYNILTALADSVPVEETGWNREWNFRTSEIRLPTINASVVSQTNIMTRLLGEIMAPIYQLATPGSYLTKDIYRYMMKHTEDELGIDKDIFRRMMKKPDAPTVDIVFAPTNPRIGEKVTAFAIPRGFKTSKEKLYYTWYLVHEGNGDVDVEDGRLEAMKIGAIGGFDHHLFFGDSEPANPDENRDAYDAAYGGEGGVGKASETKPATGDCEGCSCLNEKTGIMSMFAGRVSTGCFDDQGDILYDSTQEYFDAIDDRTESSARSGRGAVSSSALTRCYRHNFGGQNGAAQGYSGRDLIIKCHHTFENDYLGGAELSFNSDEEKLWGTNIENPDTDGDGVVDEADLIGLGQDQFTWTYRKGDRVSIAIEGTSMIPTNEGNTERMRYKNIHWEGDISKIDHSPVSNGDNKQGPEAWYVQYREEYCEGPKKDALINTGLNFDPLGAERVIPDDEEIWDYSDCMKKLWEHEEHKDLDEKSIGDMTGYYKIMWAAPGICTSMRREDAENDWCDKKGDIGFQYLKLFDPVEKGDQLMEVSVSVSPKNPQFSMPKKGDANEYSDSTDLIIANADVISQDSINPDYLYYEWSVWRCEPENFDECEDVTKQLSFLSREKGLGLRSIGFYPLNGVFKDNKALLKVGVVVKKHQNSVMSSPGINGVYSDQIFSDKKRDINSPEKYTQKYAYTSNALVEVSKNELTMNLYQAKVTGDGSWGEDFKICEGDLNPLYSKICPVYQYQVLKADIDGAGESVSWKLNGKEIHPTLNKGNNMEPDHSVVYFPITGIEGSIGRITVTSEIKKKDGVTSNVWEDDNIIEERLFTIRRPMATIINKEGIIGEDSIQRAITGAGDGDIQRSSLKGQQLWWVLGSGFKASSAPLVATHDAMANVSVGIIPRYLKDVVGNKELRMQAYINGDDYGNVLRGGSTGNQIVGTLNMLQFKEEFGSMNTLKVRTVLEFTEDYKKALKKSFNINPLDELVHDNDIKVKTISSVDYTANTGKIIALDFRQKTGVFFASTIKNTPEYLVFILRLAVSFVLISMISFGMIYGVRKV